MAFTVIAASQTDADSPLDQTLMDALRLNGDDHESRITAISAVSNQDIRDDFASSTATWSATGAGNGELWLSDESGAGVLVLTTNDHHLNMTVATGTEYGYLRGHTRKMRVILDTAHVLVFECRFKHTVNPDPNFAFGFQDIGLVTNAVATDVSDFIGIVKGSATKTLRFRTALGGSAAESADLGDTANWQRIKITVTISTSGTTRTVAGELDGAAQTWSHATSNVPNSTVLAPTLAIDGPDATTRALLVDYALFYWQTRPLSEG